jgi:hypothetical protein
MVCRGFNTRIPRPGVYVIGSAEHGWQKVGFSRFVDARLKQLSRTLPFKVTLFRFWHLSWPEDSRRFNPAKLEREIQALFAQKKINGEWFRLSERDIEALDGLIHKLASDFHFLCSPESL